LCREGNALPTVALLPYPFELRHISTPTMSRAAAVIGTATEVGRSPIAGITGERIVVMIGTIRWIGDKKPRA
jgi:hypothetical protein